MASLETKNLKHARETLHKGRAGAEERNTPPKEAEILTVGGHHCPYEHDGYLDKHLQPRIGKTRSDEERHADSSKFWGKVLVPDVSDAACDEYAEWRKKRIRQGTGERTVDRELSTSTTPSAMPNDGTAPIQPAFGPAKIPDRQMVKHCREFMTGSADELHACARQMMSNPHSVVLGFQVLFEAMTG